MTHCSLQSRALIEAYLSLGMAVLAMGMRRRAEAGGTLNETGLNAVITPFTAGIKKKINDDNMFINED